MTGTCAITDATSVDGSDTDAASDTGIWGTLFSTGRISRYVVPNVLAVRYRTSSVGVGAGFGVAVGGAATTGKLL